MFFLQSSEEAGSNTSGLLSAAEKARIPKEDYITCQVKEEEEFVQDSLEAELSAGRSLVQTDDEAFKKEEDFASEEAQTSLSGGSQGNISFPPKRAAEKARIPKEDYNTCRVKEEEEFVQDSLEAELLAGRSLVHRDDEAFKKEEDFASEEAQTSLSGGSQGNISFPPKRAAEKAGIPKEDYITCRVKEEEEFVQDSLEAELSAGRSLVHADDEAFRKDEILASEEAQTSLSGRSQGNVSFPPKRGTSSPRQVQELEEEEKREGGSDVDEGPSGEPASATVAEGSAVGGDGVPPGRVSLQMVIDRVSELERRMTRVEQLAERTARDVRLLIGTLAAQGTAKGAPAS